MTRVETINATIVIDEKSKSIGIQLLGQFNYCDRREKQDHGNATARTGGTS